MDVFTQNWVARGEMEDSWPVSRAWKLMPILICCSNLIPRAAGFKDGEGASQIVQLRVDLVGRVPWGPVLSFIIFKANFYSSDTLVFSLFIFYI